MWKSTVELGYLRHPETTSRRFDFHTGAEATKGGGGAGICAKDLAEQDVVLMNFETLENDLGQEKFASPLLHVQWWRMMTDEAQMFKTVWKSKFYGAFVLNRRVDLHAIDATPARWRGDAGSSPLDRARTAAPSLRNDLVKNCRVHPTHWLISTQVPVLVLVQ